MPHRIRRNRRLKPGNNVKKSVFMDTNMLTLRQQFGIDVFEEAKRLVPNAQFKTTTSVIKELEKIGMHGMASKIIKINKVKIVKTQGNTDAALLREAIKEKGVLCTNDKALKRKSLEKGTPVIIMRSKKKLELIE